MKPRLWQVRECRNFIHQGFGTFCALAVTPLAKKRRRFQPRKSYSRISSCINNLRVLRKRKVLDEGTPKPQQSNAILIELAIWLGLAIIIVCVVAGLLMLLWNWVVPALGGPHLRYGFALGGLLLALLLRLRLAK